MKGILSITGIFFLGIFLSCSGGKSPGTEQEVTMQDVLVFKVMNKMFTLTGLEGDPPYINLKCDPDRAIELREQYEDIQPGYHMNKVIIMLNYTVKTILITC